jgi:hypothetical protein
MSTYLPTHPPTTLQAKQSTKPIQPTKPINPKKKKPTNQPTNPTQSNQPNHPTTRSKVLPKKLTGQEIPHILWNRMVYCRIHNNPTPVPVQNQMDPD